MINQKQLMEEAAQYGIVITDAQAQSFDLYAKLLCEWNEKMNLTAITKPEEIVTKHFIDSLLLLHAYNVPQNASMIDVGTGAGFPGIALKIMRPDIQLTLLDSLGKRVQFLEAVSEALDQTNCCLHGRAEEVARDTAHREGYDVVTARAVSRLQQLCEYCIPFNRTGGMFVALKGADLNLELKEADTAIQKLGGKLFDQKPYTLPDQSKRTMIMIKKLSQTSTLYPRNYAL